VPENHSKIARFGVYEVDISAGELRKSGVRMRLQGQPFQVLTLLLERAGEPVTRDELRACLWPSDTFVDFDHSLNTAINKVREALGDAAANPRYVETLARRGYRFIAPVQWANPRASQTIPEEGSPAGGAAGIPAGVKRFHPQLNVPIPRRAITRALFIAIQVMFLSFYLAALIRLHTIQNMAETYLPATWPPWRGTALGAVVLISAGIGIPLRFYLISSASFDHQPLGTKFRQMFPLILALDQLWAVAPFLLAPNIGIGAAFAASAALLYVPFSERTLIRMAYLDSVRNDPEAGEKSAP
jgi:DNA-binding winged helix-turn-helix (wHTH) protein